MDRLIVFTGGGTAGHVLPARAVIEQLAADSSFRFAWIGSRNGIERSMVESWGIPYHPVPSGKLRRYVSVRNVIDLFVVFFGILASLGVLARLRPALLFSKGGYVSVPPVVAARILGIPVVTHESDVRAGLATRINARFAQQVLVAYEDTRDTLPPSYRERVVVTGNPVRASIVQGSAAEGLRLLGFSGTRPVILFIGGSLGSAQINELVALLLPKLHAQCDIVHQRGNHPPSRPDDDHYRSFAFVAEAFPHYLAAATLVVCRAGAGTLWELAVTGKPAILIPLGTAGSRGDQIDNARYFAARNAAVILEPSDAGAQRLLEEIDRLLGDSVLRGEVAGAVTALASGNPAATIAGLIRRVVQEA
ncbi:MAG: undecaprenyldiphospho-muramoylpentapeptide beta-N-acetylglucosaminyltransferase [Spirochaetaceae bacterium]|nr:MAG: undecaprenyldiphospho-muramoylpentapeptide beta-N-acetylglucosaminyltransferase [Spirochaetaceae bacterium]